MSFLPYHLKPALIDLILFYWIIKLPKQLNIGTSMVLGFIEDIISVSLLGTHAFTLSIISYFITIKYKILDNMCLLYQVFTVFIISFIKEIIIFFLEFLNHRSDFCLEIFIKCLINGLFWPILVFIIQKFNFKIKFN